MCTALVLLHPLLCAGFRTPMGRRRAHRSQSRSRSSGESGWTASTKSSQRPNKQEGDDIKKILAMLTEMRSDHDKRFGSMQSDIQQLLQDQRDLADRVTTLERAAPTPPATAPSQPSSQTNLDGEPEAKRARSAVPARQTRFEAVERRGGSLPAGARRRLPEVECSIVLSGFAKAKSLGEFQEALSPLFDKDVKIYTTALFTKVVFVEFPSEEAREKLLADSTARLSTNKIKVGDEEIWIKRMLPAKAMRMGYKIRSAQRWLLRKLEIDKP